jgi:hypothetical protein
MRGYIAFLLVGYITGSFVYEYDAQTAAFILYKVIPFCLSLDKAYVGYQAYLEFLTQQTVTLAQTDAHILYADLYAALLPTLGYDFLAQFNENELISFYLQALDFNTDLSLELFFTTACLHSLCTLPLAFIPFLPSHGKHSFYTWPFAFVFTTPSHGKDSFYTLQFAFVPFPLSNGIHSLYTRAFALVFWPLSQRKQEFLFRDYY